MRPTTTAPDRTTAAAVATVVPLALLLPATAVAVWWAVGDLSTPGGDPGPEFADPRLSAAGETAAGVLSLLVLLAAAVLLSRRSSLLRRDRRWWAVLLPVVAAGALLAVAHRVATAATVGANIGIGLISLPGVVLAAAALLWSLLRGSRLLLQHRRRARR
ncbi:hypothetical protein [Kineococcus sp. SYSU DK006]|uniref:hypothetical protein n=1 Tax=Kineococcus sp. SYSU DK006 TaxID=3383127 RepID=UPI003D7E0A1F